AANINNSNFSFIFKDMSSENFEVAMDKILVFFKEQKEIEYWKTYYGQFNSSNAEWNMKELNELIQKSEINKEK
ncbi:hypothetical protein D7X33_30480, partial [Butyricicoccus sp. 1XD8-22]